MFTLEPPPCWLFTSLPARRSTTRGPFRRRFALHSGTPALQLPCRLVILLLQIRILGAASFIFTGVTRLPMVAAGTTHSTLVLTSSPALRTPTNSILVATILVAALLVLASAASGQPRPSRSSTMRPISSTVCLFAMFAIPHYRRKARSGAHPDLGRRAVRRLVSVRTLFTAPPVSIFVDVPNPLHFAIKITATIP